MKKVFLILVLVMTGLSSFAVITRETEEIYTAIFASRFLKCIPCKMEQTIATENGEVKIQRFLKNWQGHKCRYSEISEKNGEKESFSCNFTREQVSSLTSAMKEDPMGKGVAAELWKKLKQDETTCQIDK